MKAAVLPRIGEELKIESVSVPEPGRHEIFIRVPACGVCHSDLHAVDGERTPLPNLPLFPGHEMTGHVAGLGEGVSGLRVGDGVGVTWMYSACGKCEYCLSGMETICKSAEVTGYQEVMPNT